MGEPGPLARADAPALLPQQHRLASTASCLRPSVTLCAAAGGPLVLGEDTETLTLAGVLSWGTGASPCAPGSQEINVWASMIDPGVC